MKALVIVLSMFAFACADVCGRVEGPPLVLDEQGPTGCWRYTGDSRCFPWIESEDACSAPHEVFHTGDKLVLWCDEGVVAPKAVMVPTECDK